VNDETEFKIERISNYEAMYWIVLSDGFHRFRTGIWVMAGIVSSIALRFLDVAPALYMLFPIVYYIVGLYKRSAKTGHIFGFKLYPEFATYKLTAFLASLGMYYCAMHGYIHIAVCHIASLTLITVYAIGLLYTGHIGIHISIPDLDKVFRLKFGEFTHEDIEGRRKVFGSAVDQVSTKK